MNFPCIQRRLKKRREFLEIAQTKQYVVTDTLIVQYKRRSVESGDIGIGFTASKKVGGAVVRNRVKRRLREVVRLFLKQVHEGTQDAQPSTTWQEYDYVVIGRKNTYHAAFESIQNDFIKALAGVPFKRETHGGST